MLHKSLSLFNFNMRKARLSSNIINPVFLLSVLTLPLSSVANELEKTLDDDNDNVPNALDVDRDNDGFIEIYTLEQLDWMRYDLKGLSLTDADGNSNSQGCPAVTGCLGYELMKDLNFDTNVDGVLDNSDAYYDYDGDGGNNGWLPIGTKTAPFQASFKGNQHRISNLYISRYHNLSYGDNPDSDLPEDSGVSFLGYVSNDSPDRPLYINDVILDGEMSVIENDKESAALVSALYASNQAQIKVFNNRISSTIKGVLATSALVSRVDAEDEAYIELSHNIIDSMFISRGGYWAAGLVARIQVSGGAQLDIAYNNSNTRHQLGGANEFGGLIADIVAESGDSTQSSIALSNNRSYAEIIGRDSSQVSGGLVGDMTVKGVSTRIIGNHSTVGFRSRDGQAGGLIGDLTIHDTALLVENNVTHGHIHGHIAAGWPLGGLIGKYTQHGDTSRSNISRNSTHVNIKGSSRVGGLMGGASLVGGQVVADKNKTSGDLRGIVSVGGLLGDLSLSEQAKLDLSGSITTGDIVREHYEIPRNSFGFGGIIGSMQVAEGGSATIFGSLSTRDIRFAYGQSKGKGKVKSEAVGGFIGRLQLAQHAETTIHSVFSSGSILGGELSYVGGAIGALDLAHSYDDEADRASSKLRIERTFYSGLMRTKTLYNKSGNNFIGLNQSGFDISLNGNYTVAQSSSMPQAALMGVGVVSDEVLRCPTSANDKQCHEGLPLYSGWDESPEFDGQVQVAWDFGTSTELPSLEIDGSVYRHQHDELPEPLTSNCSLYSLNFTYFLWDGLGDQDKSGSRSILENGCTLFLTGNSWKLSDKTVKIEEDTVLKFEFFSPVAGEIQGITLEPVNPQSGNGHRTFAVYGSQQSWGIHNTSYTNEGGYQEITIPVGQYFAGEELLIGFVNDDDAKASSKSYFRNVRFERAATCSPDAIDFTQVELESLADQDLGGTVEVLDQGCTLKMTGNTWKLLKNNYKFTANTVVELDFYSPREGDMHGIGVYAEKPESALRSRTFNFYGSGRYWGVAGRASGKDSYNSWGRYQTLRFSRIFEGNEKLGFINDDDSNVGAEGYFRNVRIFEEE